MPAGSAAGAWVVYTKRPFAGPQALLGYLCRYTHRVAISNSRLETLDLQNGQVSFRYKDYAHGGQDRSMTLSLEEFLRRFCLHILPPRLVKIRHYGLLSNREWRRAVGGRLRSLPFGHRQCLTECEFSNTSRSVGDSACPHTAHLSDVRVSWMCIVD